MHLDPAWAAVAISGVTVIANVYGVSWASRSQRVMAHFQRIDERRTDIYLDLLRWISNAESEIHDAANVLAAYETLKLPDELDLRISMFASKQVRSLVADFSVKLAQS
jgi:hypothetical protein